MSPELAGRLPTIGPLGKSSFQFFEEAPYWFPKWLQQFTIPLTVWEFSFTSLPTLVVYCLFNNKLMIFAEKAMAPHSSTFACKIPWMEEPGGLQSMGWLRVGHDWATSLSLLSFMHWRRKWQPTPVFLPGESQGRGSLVCCHLWGHTESDTTEVTYHSIAYDMCEAVISVWF